MSKTNKAGETARETRSAVRSVWGSIGFYLPRRKGITYKVTWRR